MEVIKKLQWRYATKKFDASKFVSEEKLQILKDSFNLTATSYGLQPLKMLVISNAEIKKQLVPITMDQQQVNEASHVFVICIEKNVRKKYISNYFDNVKKVRNTPEEILKPFHDFLIEDFEGKTEEQIDYWSTKQAYLAIGNLLTVCAIEEVDACPIEGFDPKAYDDLFDLKEKELQSVLVLAVGYRASDDMFSGFKKVRRGVDEVIIEID